MSIKLHFAFSTDRVDTSPQQARPNQRISFDYLRDLITGAAIAPPAVFYELPDLARRAYADQDKTAKGLLSEKKKALPYVLFSGFCPVHHNDETLQYNGCLQVDFDFKTADGARLALDALQRIKELRPAGVLYAGLSPSAFGVKILLTTNNLDKDRHGEALQAAGKYLQELLQITSKFDGLGAAQPCYLPFERTPGQAFFNPDAEPLPITFSEQSDDQVERPAIVYSDDQVAAAAQFLIDNQVDVATCYDEYFRVCCACKNAFGDQDGKQIARDILDNSAAFIASKFRSDFNGHWRSIKSRENGRMITGATLVHLARQNGFTGATARNERVLTGAADEFLVHILDRHKIDLAAVCGKYIVAPTGCGKTTLVAEYLRRNTDRRVVLVVPTRALVDRVVEREKDSGAVRFYGGKQNRQIDQNDRFIVTTVHSFIPLTTRVDLQQYDVFFDEAHALTSDTSRAYKLDVLQAFYRAKNAARSVAYLTGTDLYNFHPDFKDLERLVVKAPQRSRKTVEFYDVENILATVAEGVRLSVERGRFPVVLLNDKYLRLASLETSLDGLHLAVLNSDRKEDALFQQITRTGELPDGLQAIITTTVLKEGNDIYDDRAFDFFIVGAQHSSTIEQITARARTATKVCAYILKSTERDRSDKTFDPYTYAKLVEQRAQAFCNEHNAQSPHDDTVAIFREQELRLAIQQRPVKIDQDGRAAVCYFALNNVVFAQDTAAEYRNNELQAKNLRRYGFEILTTCRTIKMQFSDDQVAAIKVARKTCKEAKQKAHQDALNALQSAINPLAMVQRAEMDNSAPKAFKWLKRLVDRHGIEVRTAIELLRDTDSGKKYALLENRLRVHLLRSDTRYLDSGRILALQIRKIYATFRPGQQYTADELREKLATTKDGEKLLALDQSLDLAFLTPDTRDQDATIKANRRAIALLRMFFDVTESGRQTSRTCPRKRYFSLNTISQFHGHVFTTTNGKSNVYTEQAKIDRIERKIAASLVADCPF